MKKVQVISLAEADIETIIQFEPMQMEERDAGLQSAPHEIHHPPAPSLSAAISATGKQSRQRTRSPLVLGVITIALFGSAYAWWSASTHQANTVPKGPSTLPTVITPKVVESAISVPGGVAAAATAPVATSEVAVKAQLPDPVKSSAVKPPVKEIKERTTQLDKAKSRRDAILKRHANSDIARRSDAANEARSGGIGSVRSSPVPSTQDELGRLAKMKTNLLTPQQACADRSNFISRGICESRECEKPERATLKFCIDMHERRVTHD